MEDIMERRKYERLRNIMAVILVVSILVANKLSSYDFDYMEVISYVLGAIAFLSFVFGLYFEFKMHNIIDRELQLDNEAKERMTIIGTYPNSQYRSNYNKLLLISLSLLLIFILCCTIYVCYENSFSNSIFIYATILLVIASCSIFVYLKVSEFLFIIKIISKGDSKLIFNKLRETKKKYVEETKFKEKYRYEIIADEYKCKLTNYYLYKQVTGMNYRYNMLKRFYMMDANILLYEYKLDKPIAYHIVIDEKFDDYEKCNLSVRLKNNIKELLRTRIFEVTFENDRVLIKNYIKINSIVNMIKKSDVEKNINDIKTFYNQIIKEL
jgi:hypothetical protein